MTNVRYHSTVARTAYHDLLSLLLDEAAAELRGSPQLKTRNGRGYWYDRYRLGNEVKDRYLGEDTSALRARMERHERLKAEAGARRKERSRLVRLLRSERFLGLHAATGGLVLALAKSGLSRLGGTMVGTGAFRLYEGLRGLPALGVAARSLHYLDYPSPNRSTRWPSTGTAFWCAHPARNASRSTS